MKMISLVTLVLSFLLLVNFSYAGYKDYVEQWAKSATASSIAGDEFEATYATGSPDAECDNEDSYVSWARESLSGSDWIELQYDIPVYASGVYIHQNYEPYTIKVELKDENNVWHSIWTGVNEECNFNLTFGPTSYKTNSVRITVGGGRWAEIDAVQLKGYETYSVAPSVIPTFLNFKATPSIAKRSQIVKINVTITDDIGIDINSVLAQIISPEGKQYVPERPILVFGDVKSGIYSTNWTVPKNASSGVYEVYFFACDGENNCPTEKIGTITVNATLLISVSTSKNAYNQSEEIVLSGRVKDILGIDITNANVSLMLNFDEWEYFVTSKTDINGKFMIKYRTSLADPVGNWTLTLTVKDADGNEGNYSLKIPINAPPGLLYYNVIFLKPTAGDTYYRGQEIIVSVKLLDVDQPVGNAKVILKLPTGEQLVMNELAPGLGIYQTVYRIKYTDRTGNWSLGVEGTKETPTGLYGGARSISVNVRPVELKIELVSPTNTRFTVGEIVKIKVKVLYPDNTPASGIDVKATPTAKAITLIQTDVGTYEGSYVFSSEELGKQPFRVYASDASENTGYIEQSIFITQPGILDYIIQHWYLTVFIIVIIVYLGFRLGTPAIKAGKIKSELERLEAMRKETQEKYFVKGTMDEATYRKIISEVDEKILQLKSKMEQIKKKKGE